MPSETDDIRTMRDHLKAGHVLRLDSLRNRILILSADANKHHLFEDDLPSINRKTYGCIGIYGGTEKILIALLTALPE